MLKKAYGGCRSWWELNIHGKDQEREEAQRNSFKARKTLWLLASISSQNQESGYDGKTFP